MTRPIEPLTEAEVDAMIRAASPDYPSGARARALVALGAYAGLRVGELLALRPKDVNLETLDIAVLHGKGDKQRAPSMLPAGALHVDRWLRKRQELGIKGGPLLCTVSKGRNALCGDMQPGRPIQRPYVARLLLRLAEKAGIEKRVHPHGLRHTHAHLLALQGVLVTDIRDQLGHSNLSTTSRYLEKFSPSGRAERIQALFREE